MPIPITAPERHRDYFRRELQVGRRIVCEWNVHDRWPTYGDTFRENVIDGFEFRTEEDATAFNLDAMTGTPDYDLESWEAAESWVAEEPTSEMRSIHEKLEDSRALFEGLGREMLLKATRGVFEKFE